MRRALRWLTTAAALAFGSTPAQALAEPIRILVTAGSKLGLPAERPLRFADADARRVRDVMVAMGGVKSEHAFQLSEPTRRDLFDAIARARAEAQRHPSDEVTLLFYFSGHGDREALHLGGDRVLVSDIEARLAEVPAALRIAVTDACRSTREKGFNEAEPFAISAALIPRASGQVWLHASSDGEAAQESDELGGAIFTQAWVSGLRGAADANGDARVTLDESFAFAHSQTLIRSAKSSGVVQKPEAVVHLRETAPVVLTQTSARLSTLTLPRGRDVHYLVYSAIAKSVLSEVWGSSDRALDLRVPAGRYVIQRRSGGGGGAAQIAIGEGETRRLDSGDFSSTTLEALARKGADPDHADDDESRPRPNELSAGYDLGWNARTGLVQGPRATYAHAWGSFALTLGAGAELSGRALATKDEDLVGGFARAGGELRLPVSPVIMLRGGLGGRAGVLFQTLTPRGALRGSPRTSAALAVGPEIVVGGRLALARAWFADLAATGGIAFLREEAAVAAIPGGTLALSLGARF